MKFSFPTKRIRTSTDNRKGEVIDAVDFKNRSTFLVVIFFLLIGTLIGRLGYWQVVKGEELRQVAAQQYQRNIVYEGERGSIKTADNFDLVTNQPVLHVYGQPHLLDLPPQMITKQLLPILTPYVISEWEVATESGTLSQKLTELESTLTQKLSNSQSKWVPLFPNLKITDAQTIKNLKIKGLTFENGYQRIYPEASMAAHILGFVGSNNQGEATGYFGVEGALNKELQSKRERRTVETDAVGGRLSADQITGTPHGRDVVLTIQRDVQNLAETELKNALVNYGAKSGEVIIMEPETGKILALASYPNYDPSRYQTYPNTFYRNPSVSDVYEPGSTFKTLTVAAGIDAGLVTENTQCPRCATARTIGKYTLKTWNDKYNPDITMSDALAKSDNTAMIFVAEELGTTRFQEYLKKFGIGQSTNIELQEDFSPSFPEKWGPVELATRSFGQGISATSMQMVKAVNAIANQGRVMRPLIVNKVIDHATGEEIINQPITENQAISAQTAHTVTKMMVHAAASGEAKWTASRTHLVAGKTGTSQIAAEGSYDASKTIASFIGFAPANDPQFIMMVKLVEPSSSIWAAETAAPLWYKIANKLYLLLQIPPDFPAGTTPEQAFQDADHALTLD